MSVEIAVIGPQRPFVLETLEREFLVHKVSTRRTRRRRCSRWPSASAAW